jgi:hypothetical protein
MNNTGTIVCPPFALVDPGGLTTTPLPPVQLACGWALLTPPQLSSAGSLGNDANLFWIVTLLPAILACCPCGTLGLLVARSREQGNAEVHWHLKTAPVQSIKDTRAVVDLVERGDHPQALGLRAVLGSPSSFVFPKGREKGTNPACSPTKSHLSLLFKDEGQPVALRSCCCTAFLCCDVSSSTSLSNLQKLRLQILSMSPYNEHL